MTHTTLPGRNLQQMHFSPLVIHRYTSHCQFIAQRSPIWSCVSRELAINQLQLGQAVYSALGETCFHILTYWIPNKIGLHFHILKKYWCLLIQLSFQLVLNGHSDNLLIFMPWAQKQCWKSFTKPSCITRSGTVIIYTLYSIEEN